MTLIEGVHSLGTLGDKSRKRMQNACDRFGEFKWNSDQHSLNVLFLKFFWSYFPINFIKLL
jgi:hypothetical protein